MSCDSTTGECEKIIGARIYFEDTAFSSAVVTFAGNPGTEDPVGNGVYRGTYELKEGVNTIPIHATATAMIQTK